MFQWLLDTMVSNIWTYHYFFNSFYNKNILGETDDDINFTYEANTEVYESCAASLNDEMWVLGGHNQKRQVNFNWLYEPCMFTLRMKFILDE